MDSDEGECLSVVSELATWVHSALRWFAAQSEATAAGQQAAARLRVRAISIGSMELGWVALPLKAADAAQLSLLARWNQLAAISRQRASSAIPAGGGCSSRSG